MTHPNALSLVELITRLENESASQGKILLVTHETSNVDPAMKHAEVLVLPSFAFTYLGSHAGITTLNMAHLDVAASASGDVLAIAKMKKVAA